MRKISQLAMTISSFLEDLLERLLHRRSLLLYATTWTALITTTVAVVSFSPEFAFTWAVSQFAGECEALGLVRLPLDGPAGEVVCLPAQLFERCGLDLVVPPVFAAVVVAASISFVRAVGLWEADEEEDTMV